MDVATRPGFFQSGDLLVNHGYGAIAKDDYITPHQSLESVIKNMASPKVVGLVF